MSPEEIKNLSLEEKKANDLTQIKVFVGFMASVVAVIILHQLKYVFVPLCLALLLYFLFNGVVKRLIDKRIPQVLVLIFLMIFIFIVFYFFGVLMYASVTSFADKFPEYSGRLRTLIDIVFTQLKIPESNFHEYIQRIDLTHGMEPAALAQIVTRGFGSFAAFVGNLALVLVFFMFMLAGRQALTGRITKAFVPDRSQKIRYVLNSIEDQVQRYLLIKTFVSFLAGLLSGLIMFFGGVDFYILSGLLIFVLHYIPNFGAIVATIIPSIIALLKYGFTLRSFVIVLALTVVQFTIGNILEPKITGKSLNLSPILILVSLIFWGYIWGIVGMVLAVPITSAIKIFFENIQGLKPIAEIISAE